MALLLTATLPCAAAVPNPTPIDLGAGCNHSEAYDINAAGQVVGFCNLNGYSLPFIWQNGEMTLLPLPNGYAEGYPMSINASGQIAGVCDANGSYNACLWTPTNGGWAVTPLGVPAPYETLGIEEEIIQVAFSESYASKINDAGQVLVMLGPDGDLNSSYYYAGIWKDYSWTVLAYSEGEVSVPIELIVGPSKMNENGQVLLEIEESLENWGDLHLWDNGTSSPIVYALNLANLNNSGQIVGTQYIGDWQRNNFTYDSSSGTPLTTFLAEDDGYSLVNINDSGQVLVAYPTTEEYENGERIAATTELGIISFDDYKNEPDQVTSLGFVGDFVDEDSLNFNANGEVSGNSPTADVAFFASSASGVVPLNGLDENSTHIRVTAMNDSGVVVGYSGTTGSFHAMVWGISSPAYPPTADPGGPYLAAVNAEFTVDGSASFDPDNYPLTYSWEFDNKPNRGVAPSFVAPTEPGIYPLALTVDDGLDGSSTALTTVVVYDPSAGFVTGGGWIDSPADAYTADPTLAGKATFGFVSKYQKGADLPTGNTAFEFQAGDLRFHSTGYEWLVVTGSDYARFKGSGTINGTGDYKFMVWAGDNDPDRFRIKIWEEDEDGNETVIYDNESDQPIGGGSIVIHAR